MQKSAEQRFLHLVSLEKRADLHLKRALKDGSYHRARRAAFLVEAAHAKANNSCPMEITSYRS